MEANHVMFDVGYYQGSIPITERYCQNFEHSGFMSLIECTYEEMRGIDPKIAKAMPFSAYLHVMSGFLNAHIIDVDTSFGNRPIHENEYISFLFGPDALIPAVLFYYLQCYSTVVSASGDLIQPNLPTIAVPRIAATDIPAGTFGPIHQNDHNKYEAYISPYVTAQRVVASSRGDCEWQPLPANFFPQGAAPTQNLLGYGPIDILTAEGRGKISNLDFPQDDSPAARIQFNAKLFSCVQTYLKTISEKFKMNSMPFAESKSLTRIPPKISNSMLEFVEAPDCGNHEILRHLNVTVHSLQACSKNQATAAAILATHRRRTNSGFGPCFLVNDTAPQGWQDSRNNNFSMTEPFESSSNVRDYSLARTSRYMAHGPKGYRTQLIQGFLKQFHIEKKP